MKKLIYSLFSVAIGLSSCGTSNNNTLDSERGIIQVADGPIAKATESSKPLMIRLSQEVTLSVAFEKIAENISNTAESLPYTLDIQVSNDQVVINSIETTTPESNSEADLMGWNVYNTCPTDECLKWALQESVRDLEFDDSSNDCLHLLISQSLELSRVKSAIQRCNQEHLSLNQ